MNDKTKIYDYACNVVNFGAVVKFHKLAEWIDGGEYKVDDAVDEWIKTNKGRAFMRDWAKHKLSGNVMLQYKEHLITHTVNVLTELYANGNKLGVK
jgi:hypothetical protein